MTPALAAAIDAARELAWQPTHNVSPHRHAKRREAYEAFIDALARLDVEVRRTGDPVVSVAAIESRFLLAAMRRIAACSFASRMGMPYRERKQSMLELRGCVAAFDRQIAWVTTSRPAAAEPAPSTGALSRQPDQLLTEAPWLAGASIPTAALPARSHGEAAQLRPETAAAP
jgi:hypothetical protein